MLLQILNERTNIEDVVVLTTGHYGFTQSKEVKLNKLTRKTTNCSDPINMYKGQQFDLGIECVGVLLHILAIFLALRARRHLLDSGHRKLKNVKI